MSNDQTKDPNQSFLAKLGRGPKLKILIKPKSSGSGEGGSGNGPKQSPAGLMPVPNTPDELLIGKKSVYFNFYDLNWRADAFGVFSELPFIPRFVTGIDADLTQDDYDQLYSLVFDLDFSEWKTRVKNLSSLITEFRDDPGGYFPVMVSLSDSGQRLYTDEEPKFLYDIKDNPQWDEAKGLKVPAGKLSKPEVWVRARLFGRDITMFYNDIAFDLKSAYVTATNDREAASVVLPLDKPLDIFIMPRVLSRTAGFSKDSIHSPLEPGDHYEGDSSEYAITLPPSDMIYNSGNPKYKGPILDGALGSSNFIGEVGGLIGFGPFVRTINTAEIKAAIEAAVYVDGIAAKRIERYPPAAETSNSESIAAFLSNLASFTPTPGDGVFYQAGTQYRRGLTYIKKLVAVVFRGDEKYYIWE